MNLKKKKINLLFEYWLILSLIFVFSIIIVGGLTRLTNSGLSIIEWEIIKGIIPPMSNSTWTFYFDKYKTIPQYNNLNFNMTLDEFKFIFYWEYFHRLLARFIGLFFLLPLIFFYISKKIKSDYLKNSFFILILIILQGVVGWYMVKSGLVNDVTVSHYRLSIHLTLAIVIICSIFWLLRNFQEKKDKSFFKISKQYAPYQSLICLIFLQIIFGAFVSGLDAGKIYQTWPLMDETFFPNDILTYNYDLFFEFDNHSLVQFYHRILAYLLIIYVIILAIHIFRKKLKYLYKSLSFLIISLITQISLGIFTLISGLNIYLASAHQVVGVILVFSAINIYYLNVK